MEPALGSVSPSLCPSVPTLSLSLENKINIKKKKLFKVIFKESAQILTWLAKWEEGGGGRGGGDKVRKIALIRPYTMKFKTKNVNFPQKL